MIKSTDKRHLVRVAGAALALTLGLSAAPLRAFAAPVGDIPTPTILPLPIGKRLTAFSKNAIDPSGRATVVTKVCHGQFTQEMTNLYLCVRMHPGPCDEGFSKLVLNGYFIAYTNLIRRLPDRRGAFDGRWKLIRPDGFVLAAGDWHGTVGCGTHRSPGTPDFEKCDEPEHFEGKLDGVVLVPGIYKGSRISATLAGTGPLQPVTLQRISFEGVVISECITLPLLNAPEFELPQLGPPILDLERFAERLFAQ